MRLSDAEQGLVETVSRKDAVLRILRGAITDGRLAPGERLDQNELAERFGVSRMPVREALKQLQVEGLVVVYPRRGVEVARLDPSTIVEMFEVRIALEQLALSRGVPLLKSASLDEMEEVLIQMDGLLGEPSADDPWMTLNGRFHALANGASEWPHLLETISQYRSNVERYVRSYFHHGGRAQSQDEHWQLLRACRERDVPKAQAVIALHLRNTAVTLTTAIASEGAARSA
ncbi:GntR family transcriptional regulator [Aureimonas sp. AU22]|jgi:DNA-binding GntR family transcriptional regulator|uniref:GntR family transcriptional regulator n=1 Tax=Aureimonas sp. AU22 TaxID=1638162 RepID=UPI0009EA7711|nr:GntR family transcriptional regulator [Aureimonas sp. AU22]